MAEVLRGTSSFFALSRELLQFATSELGILRGVVEAHASSGQPLVCVATTDHDRDELRAYVAKGFLQDAQLALVHRTHAPVACDGPHGGLLLAPLLGDGELIGLLRLEPPPDADAGALVAELAAMCTHVSVRLAHNGVTMPVDRHPLAKLTPRQRHVTRHVALGRSNAEISVELGISANAVKKHVGLVLAALEVSNRTELAALVGRALAVLELLDDEGRAPAGYQVVRADATTPRVWRRRRHARAR